MKNAWYLAIFLIPLVMNPWGMQLYGSGKIFWFFGMVGLFLVGVFFSRWADLRRFALKFHRGIYLYLGLWVVSFLLSTVFSLAPVRSFFGEYSLMQGSLFYIFLAAHFLICLALFSDKNLQRLFFWLVKWIGAVAAIAAILLWTAPEYSNRLFGASGQPNFLAQFLIFPLFIVLFDVFGKSGRMKKKVRGRIADFVVMVLLAAVIFLTGSRAVEIGIGFSLWLMFVLIWNGKAIYKLLITVGLIVVVIAGLWNFGLEMRSLNLRFFLWKGAAQSLNSENIWMGSGVETFYRQFAAVMPKEVFENEQFYRVPESPHNEFLEALTERGIFGAALYLIPLGFLLMLVWKKEDRRKFLGIKTLEVYLALVAYYVAVQFSFSVMEHWVYLAAFWAVLLLKVVKFRNFEIGKVRIVALPVGVFAIIFAVFYLRMDILLARGMSVFIEDDAAYGYFDDAA
ncbi:O-antigen ligase family protein, partial [Candidatus Peregrinibacteria bacterium]|nr:O-antigen ligase family protein [Candidatus Peregrinibacteria bacterium]